MVALRDITSDYFEFDQDHYRIVGKRSKVVYNLGDAVRIRVKKANLDQKLLDFELVETGNEDRLGKDGDAGEGHPYFGEEHPYSGEEHPYFSEEHPYSGEEQTDSGKGQSQVSGKNARKEKIRKAIRESKRKASKSGKSKDGRTSGKSVSGKKKDSRSSGKSKEGRSSGKKK